MKDLCPHYETIAFRGDDHKDVSSDSESGTLQLYRTQSDGSLAELEETDSDSDHNGDSNDTDLLIVDAEVVPPKEFPPILRKRAHQRRSPSPCYLHDHEIRGSVVKEITYHLRQSIRKHVSCAGLFQWQKMAVVDTRNYRE